jgi:hypothetical protein
VKFMKILSQLVLSVNKVRDHIIIGLIKLDVACKWISYKQTILPEF